MMSAQKINTRRRRPRRGFTLAEMLVVLGIMMMSISLIMPVLRGLFVGGGDLAAVAAMGGMLSTARGLAIETQTYALLHVQPGTDERGGWAAPMKYDLATRKFAAAEGFAPQRLPEGYAFGEVERFVSGNTFSTAVNTDAGMKDFLTFNVIFAGDGSLVLQVNGAAPVIDTAALVFAGVGKVKIWDAAPATAPILNETGVRVMAPVQYMTFRLTTDRDKLLNAEKRFLVINPYTGQLLREE